MKKAGREKTSQIIPFDASPAGKQAVFERKDYGSPQQFPRKIAKGAVQAIVQ